MKTSLLQAISIVLFASLIILAKSPDSNRQNEKMSDMKEKNISITIIYDNNPFENNLQCAWGFSCLIRGFEKTILFDTGGDGTLLMNNMHKLNINPNEIDAIFLSHHHRDHTGGLDEFLKVNAQVMVFLPHSFPSHFKDAVILSGAKLVEVSHSREIIPNVYTSGEMGTHIIEQAMILCGPDGLVVITGCAHPGIVNIIRSVKDQLKEEIRLVMGGFHLGGESHNQIASIVSSFRLLGVQFVAPCHCTGDEASLEFAREYKGHYLKCGAGKVIQYQDSK